jgi:hypothetical protein
LDARISIREDQVPVTPITTLKTTIAPSKTIPIPTHLFLEHQQEMGFETEFIARRGILQANVKLRQIQANESLRSKVKSSLLKHVGLYEAPRREAQSAAFRAKASREEQDVRRTKHVSFLWFHREPIGSAEDL